MYFTPCERIWPSFSFGRGCDGVRRQYPCHSLNARPSSLLFGFFCLKYLCEYNVSAKAVTFLQKLWHSCTSCENCSSKHGIISCIVPAVTPPQIADNSMTPSLNNYDSNRHSYGIIDVLKQSDWQHDVKRKLKIDWAFCTGEKHAYTTQGVSHELTKAAEIWRSRVVPCVRE